MYCPNCGKEIPDTSKFCTECGTSVADVQPVIEAEVVEAETVQEQPNASYQQAAPVYEQPAPVYTQASYSGEAIYNREASSGLFLAAFVLNIVSTVSLAPFIVPLAWCIPMTIHSYNIYKGKKPNTVAFGVCTLIFLNLVAGILMLVADKEE